MGRLFFRIRPCCHYFFADGKEYDAKNQFNGDEENHGLSVWFLVILQGYYSILTWNQAKFQKDTLREIRLIIESSIGRIESEKLDD